MATVTVEAVEAKKLLVNILCDLNPENLDKFKSLIKHDKDFPHALRRQLKAANTEDVAELIIDTYSQQGLEMTKKALTKMNRTDLVHRLSIISSATKGMNQPTFTQRVEKIVSVMEQLLRMLAGYNGMEIMDLICHIHRPDQFYREGLGQITDLEDAVFLLVRAYGCKSVDKLKKILKQMGRTDRPFRLQSLQLKKTHLVGAIPYTLIYNVARMAAVKEMLVETLLFLSNKEFMKFKWFLQFAHFQRSLPLISWSQLEWADREETVDLMIEAGGQRSVEVTREVLTDIYRTDLVQWLSDSSSGLDAHTLNVNTTEKESCCGLTQKVEMMASIIDLLSETLADLGDSEIKDFKQQLYSFKHDCDWSFLARADTQETVFYIVQLYGHESVEKTKEVLEKMKKMDYVKTLSERSLAPQKEPPMDKNTSALIHKVTTVAAVKHLLLEMLHDLSHQDLRKFKDVLQITMFYKDMLGCRADNKKIVSVIMETFSQKSVEVTKSIFEEIKRKDVIEKFLKTKEGHKDKLFVDEEPEPLERVPNTYDLRFAIQKLSFKESKTFKWLLWVTYFQKGVPQIPWEYLKWGEEPDQQWLEVSREILREMNRTDLIERLPETSLDQEGKHGLKQHLKRQTKLGSEWESVHVSEKDNVIYQKIKHREDREDVVQMRVERCRQEETKTPTVTEQMQSLQAKYFEAENKAQNIMGRIKLLHESIHPFSIPLLPCRGHGGLLEPIPASMGEVQPGSLEIQNVREEHNIDSTMAKNTEEFLSSGDKAEASSALDLSICGDIYIKPSSLQLCAVQMEVSIYNVVIYYKMNPASLKLHVYVVPDYPGMQERVEARELHSGYKFIQKPQTKYTPHSYPLDPPPDYSDLQFFKVTIQNPDSTFKLTVRNHLNLLWTAVIQKDDYLPTFYAHGGGIVESGAFENPCIPILNVKKVLVTQEKDPNKWTKCTPKVSSIDGDNAPTYSLQSKAGNFECSVSGLRWVCEDEATFKYQFCSWGGHMERMEHRQYMPAGPLIDITVVDGRLNEVYLPHWICIDDDPALVDQFAVLHIDDCGDVVEGASEVTSSHVKLSEPIFSPRAALMKIGFAVKISCNVLIYYKAKTTFLKLHVYLIPHNPALQQAVDKEESSNDYELIRKPRPDQYLMMQKCFTLTADIDSAKIIPQNMTLRYDSQDPNFYEVFIESPDRAFHLILSYSHTHKGIAMCRQVWTCEIRRDDYPNIGLLEAEGSLCKAANAHTLGQENDEHFKLIPKAENISAVKEKLLTQLEQLKRDEYMMFKWQLDISAQGAGLPCIPKCKLENISILDLVDLMVNTYCENTVDVTKMVFEKMNRNDLVKVLSETSSASMGRFTV